jgi:hypothetical protein
MAYKFNDQNRKKIASSETIIVSSLETDRSAESFLGAESSRSQPFLLLGICRVFSLRVHDSYDAEPPQAVRVALIMPNVFLVLDDLVRRDFRQVKLLERPFATDDISPVCLRDYWE